MRYWQQFGFAALTLKRDTETALCRRGWVIEFRLIYRAPTAIRMCVESVGVMYWVGCG